MSQLFISHAEEDQTLAAELADALERTGFRAWYYERDGLPGIHYLEQVFVAIERCEVFILIVSPASIRSRNVTAEIFRAHEAEKNFLPMVRGLSHNEIQAQMKPAWKMALVGSTSITIPPAGVSAILSKLEQGIRLLGVTPAQPPTPPEVVQPPEVKAFEPPAGDEAVLSVFAPVDCSPGDTVLFQVWLHPPGRADEVEEAAREADAGARLRASGAVPEALTHGVESLLQLIARGVEIDPPEDRLVWGGVPTSAQFAVSIPVESRPSVQLAQATLSLEGVTLAVLKFKLNVVAAAETATKEGAPPAPAEAGQTFRRYRTAFLSYAFEDKPEVLKRAQFLSAAGISFFMDFIDLKAGDDWLETVTRQISGADVFYLFWSKAASRSAQVRAELGYALERQRRSDDGRPEIIPVILYPDAPPPPPELDGVHFLDSMAYFVSPDASPELK